jgi:hypothetical protein
MMDDDALFARIDEVMRLEQTELRKREEARYDGIMGKLSNWLPENFHREFEAIRNKLLATYRHRDLLDYIAEMRREWGMQGNRDAGELAELVELDGALQERELGLSHGGMLSGTFCPRTPAPIRRDVSRLAQFQEAVELGPENGLAVLLGDEHAKTATIGANRRQKQTEKASKSRSPKLGDDKITLDDIIEKLAAQRDSLNDFIPAPDLWQEFIGALDVAHANPNLKRHTTKPRKSVIQFLNTKGKTRSITRGTFETKIGEIRKKLSG